MRTNDPTPNSRSRGAATALAATTPPLGLPVEARPLLDSHDTLSTLASLETRLDRIADHGQRLSRELSRCHEQLHALYEITENLADERDAATIESALLSRFAKLLDARAIYCVHDDEQNAAAAPRCERMAVHEAAGADVVGDPVRLGEQLNETIDRVRDARRAIVAALRPADRMKHARDHALVALLRRGDDRRTVFIATRGHEQPDFDAGDRLAADTMLAYGGHILSNAGMIARLERGTLDTVATLARAIEARDAYTSGHSSRVAWLARLTGAALRLPHGQLQMLEWAGLLHDVGKLGVPEHILNKPDKLTDAEFEIVKRHPQVGYDMLRPVESLRPILAAVLHHHENHDGSGYPHALAGEAIPLEARILHVVDVFDALSSNRSYRAAYSIDEALDILRRGAGSVTDPRITRVFAWALRQYRKREPDEFARLFSHAEGRDETSGDEP